MYIPYYYYKNSQNTYVYYGLVAAARSIALHWIYLFIILAFFYKVYFLISDFFPDLWTKRYYVIFY